MDASSFRSSESVGGIVFGPFELDVRAGELRKGGARIRLPDQPLQVLLMLLARPGSVVLREEIRDKLWPDSTVVEFDHSINAAVRRLRDALRESADKPRYVETIPRRGYRFIGQVEISEEAATNPGATIAPAAPDPLPEPLSQLEDLLAPAPASIPRLRRLWGVFAAVSAALAILTVVGVQWYSRRQAPIRWAREIAIPQAGRLLAAEDYAAAFPLIFKALQILPHDVALNRMHHDVAYPIPIRTTPPGASVYVKPYSQPDSAWLFIGQSPLEDFLLPFGYYRWRIVKPGYQTVETAAGIVGPTIDFVLDRSDSVGAEMQHVPGGNVRVLGLNPVHLDDFWIDQFEVTNRRFKEFVDQGGYKKLQYWREPFVRDGRVLSREQAMAEFRDTTGQPGPSTWEVGGYPPGHDDFPVNGVSWYEAAAYAKFANKCLPTIYHWHRAAAQSIYSDILLFSNFGGDGPVPVGSRQGIGEFGTYDMAGNVKEWCLNAAGSRRYILGGSWNEGRSSYAGSDALSPFDRSPTNGFRCVRYPNVTVPDTLAAPVDIALSDRRSEKPVSDSVFRILQRFYSYEGTDPKPVRESSDESASDWKTERMSFNAAYGHERMIVWLYLPKHAKPPFQTVIYFPAGASRILPRIDQAEVKRFDFLMRSGRAVVLPVYQGTYERRQAHPQGPSRERDLVIQQVQDFRRSIDYLETRADIAHDRLGFFGISGGSQVGIIALAQEPRIRAATLAESGIGAPKEAPEIDPLNFAPRVRIPVLMLNGRYDFVRPVETQQLPLFRLLGAPPNEKRMVLSDSGHAGPIKQYIKETLDWFDRYLGSVVR